MDGRVSKNRGDLKSKEVTDTSLIPPPRRTFTRGVWAANQRRRSQRPLSFSDLYYICIRGGDTRRTFYERHDETEETRPYDPDGFHSPYDS